MAMKQSPRVLIASLVAMLLIFLLNTCGIEQFIPQLNPPINPEKVGSAFNFTKSTFNSEPEFIGFDLYYRMYQIQDIPDPNDIVEFADLGTNGFRRIHSSNDKAGQIQLPLIPIDPADKGAEFIITVDYTGVQSKNLELVDPFPLIDYGGGITDIRRDVYDGLLDDSYKRFSQFSEGDADIKSYPEVWVDIDNGDAVKIVLYVVSYGYDIANKGPLRSEPVKLGEIDRDFP